MELMLSNFPPANFSGIKSTHKFFEKNLEDSDHIKIATGYISSDSLIELKKIIEVNEKKPQIQMLIGMHYFDGFTKTQYNAANSLNQFLIDSNLGSISISNKLKFHGKMYSFSKNGSVTNSIIGSSNFSSVLSNVGRIYEADFLFSDNVYSKSIDSHISQLIDKIGTPLNNVNINTFNEYNSLLEGHDGVKKIDASELTEAWRSRSIYEYDIPIKTEPKSNLNAFFGKGRVNQRGFEMPRPWYEVELIVSKKITESTNFPYNKSFEVITDDGWSFKCKTSGDFSKNFRSEDDLKILGKWIKGRLENFGALEIGKPVTEQVLRKYGRNSIKLVSTHNPDIWLLDFKF